MISIVMPTLWKGEFYKKMLPILSAHELVGEIIIIDNSPDNVDKEILSLEKIKYLPQKENIFVNPAWNLGVEVSSYDRICLYSDDVLFDPSVIDAVYPFMSEDKGITGFAYESISENHQSLFRADWEIPQIVPTWTFHYRFGICMFMHKNSFHKISDFSCSRCVKRVFYSAFVWKCTYMCKHRFGVQLLQNPPLCSSTVRTCV